MARLADLTKREIRRPPGARVVIDLRLLQEPARAPLTAAYLESLLGAFAADPLPGEDLVPILRLRRPDPTVDLEARGLRVAGRRRVLPTARALRSLGLPLDALLLRGAEARIRTADPATHGVVFHTAGGALPTRSALPVVATLLDLAPWELPEQYARSAAARLGHRTRVAGLRRAARVLVASRASADSVVRLLGVEQARIAVVPLAADDAFRPGPPEPESVRRLLESHHIPERYLVVGGRYDARSDLPTLLAALRALRAGSGNAADLPCLVLVGAAGHDPAARSRVTQLAERHGVLDLVRLTPPLPVAARAALESAAVGHVQPALSDATGMAAHEALAAGVPVIASRTGALPEIVGAAGIIVEPRETGRLAAALVTLWSGGPVAAQVTRAAQAKAAGPRRRWGDVAQDTRTAYVAALDSPAEADAAGDALG
jgi:glycosyltransferase involved in cell wall biosynthesis